MTLARRGAGFVGVFDSGVGGISVLRELVRVCPAEDFVFFGDSANAPYGDREVDDIRRLTAAGIGRLVDAGAKAIVIACNTATSAAAEELRNTYADIPIVGVEPALKPAVEAYPQGRILVMATQATLSLDKFQRLNDSITTQAQVMAVACPGLADRVERGNLDAPDVIELLERLIGGYRGQVDAVVLGCTHYPFLRRQIRQVLGDVELFDGGEGTARQLERRLEESGLLRSGTGVGTVAFTSSVDTPEERALQRQLFEAGQ